MEKENKKTNKKLIVILIIVAIILVIVAATIGGIFGYHLIQKALLINEVNQLTTNIDLTVDTVNTEDIITFGEYAKVEKAIKSYLKDCGTEMQKMMEIMKDERIINLLAIENYEQDGPEFSDTLAYIEDITKQLSESSQKTVKLMNKEEMFNYIDNYDVKEQYEELYRELMLDEETEKDLKESQTQLQESINTLLEKLEISKEILNFLKQNKTKWHIDNDILMFDSQKLVDQYNELITKLQQ